MVVVHFCFTARMFRIRLGAFLCGSCMFAPVGVSPGYSGFLSESTNMWIMSNGYIKVPIDGMRV